MIRADTVAYGLWRMDVTTGALAAIPVPPKHYASALATSGDLLALEVEARQARSLAVFGVTSESYTAAPDAALVGLGYAGSAPRFSPSSDRVCWDDMGSGVGCIDVALPRAIDRPMLPTGALPSAVSLPSLAPSLRWYVYEEGRGVQSELWIGGFRGTPVDIGPLKVRGAFAWRPGS